MAHFLASLTDSALPPGCSKCVTVMIGNKTEEMKIHSFWGVAGRRRIFTDVSNHSDVLNFRASCRKAAVRTANIVAYKISALHNKSGTSTYFSLIIIKRLLLCNYTTAFTGV